MHRHTGPAPGIMVWVGIGYHSRTPLVRIAGTLNIQRYISEMLEPVVLPYLQGLATAIFQQENMWSMVAQRLTQIVPPAATQNQLWQRVEAAWSAVPQEHIQSLLESMPRRVAAVIANNGGYSGYRFWLVPHFTEVYKFNHLILGQHVIHKIHFCCAISCLSWCCIYGGQQCRIKHLRYYCQHRHHTGYLNAWSNLSSTSVSCDMAYPAASSNDSVTITCRNITDVEL
ncbi:transposable element Tcb1 transposase [Trichonephila clavipes]|nr:transposable element Tcb1 transposase [Trichonephila clavipes]